MRLVSYVKSSEKREVATAAAVELEVSDDAYRGLMQGGAVVLLPLRCRGRQMYRRDACCLDGTIIISYILTGRHNKYRTSGGGQRYGGGRTSIR